MPELPEVETVCQGLRPVLEGQVIQSFVLRRPDLRFPFPPDLAREMEGAKVFSLKRRGKYMLWTVESANNGESYILLTHLGMSGTFSHSSQPYADNQLTAHDHVVLVTQSGHTVRYNDPRRFGFMDFFKRSQAGQNRFLAPLGPEPLGTDFTAPYLQKALQGRSSPIKTALLNQSLVAGLGNIYASEALFHAGISPRRKADSLGPRRCARLVEAIRRVLREAIAAGGSSLKDYRQANGDLGYFQKSWAVYDRFGLPCPGCSCDLVKTKGIKRLVQGGRTTYYCASRQK